MPNIVQIKPLDKSYKSALHFLIMGKPGSGKTYSLLTLPRPLLIIDVEGGLNSIINSGQDVEGISYIQISDFEGLEELLKGLKYEDFKSIAIDTYSSLQSFHVIKKSLQVDKENIQWSDWNYMLLSLKNLFYTMRQHDVIFVVNVHEKIDRTSLVPLLQGQSASEIFNYVDYAFRAMIVDGKYVWKIRSDTEPLKFRGRQPNADYIEQNYTKLINFIKSHQGG